MGQNKAPNFRIGIQLADDAGNADFGQARYTRHVRDGGSIATRAFDADKFDPDAVRVALEVEQSKTGKNDFRVGAQAYDDNGIFGSNTGTAQFTPWASEGGGSSPLVTDSDEFDPDGYKIILETRPWTSNRTLRDVQLGIQMYDDHGNVAGDEVYTVWASQGGGWTEWAVDPDEFDPDGFKLLLGTRFE
jgi:hypothetical protein